MTYFNIHNHHHKLLVLHVFLHIAGITGLIMFWDPLWLLITLFAKWLFYNLGVEIGLHRLISHRSFKTSILTENILVFLSIFGGFGSSLGWAANHRVHHRNSDKENDPHPAHEPIKTWFWLDTNTKVNISPTVVKDLLKNPFHKWTRDNYFKIWIIATIVLALISVKFTVYFLILPGMLSMFSGGVINVICHKFGYRNFETNDESRNNLWVNIFAMGGGSGLHNNHHMNPGSYRTKVKWHELDLDGWIIEKWLMR